MLSERETLLMAHLLNFSKLIHTFKRYWTMHWSLASYSPWIFLTTSWESLHISSLDADKVWARLSPTRIASYLASLLEVGNLSRIAYSSRSSVGDCKRRPIPDPEPQDAPLTCSIHHSFFREFASWWDFWGVSAIKSAMTCPFIANLSWYLISYSICSMVHLTSLPDRSGLCRIFLNG